MTESKRLRMGKISTLGFLLRFYGDCYKKKGNVLGNSSKFYFLQKERINI